MGLEQRKMLMTNSKVDIYLSLRRSVHCPLHQVLQSRSTRTVFIRMEKKKTFRQITIVHIFQEVADRSLLLQICELRSKSKTVLFSKEFLDETSLFSRFKVLKQILEHTACSTTSRHKFEDSMPFIEVILPCFNVSVNLVF